MASLTRRKEALRRISAAVTLSAVLVSSSTFAAAQDNKPFVVGVDVGANPYVIANPDGSITGFNIDLLNEVSKRLARPTPRIIDQQFAGIFAGLEAKRYDFIAAPVTVTRERAERMLFIESFLGSSYQLLTRKDAPPIEKIEDLNGKTIAVNNGSAYDNWLTENQSKFTYSVERYGKNADAFQAVLAKRADAAMSGDGNVMYAASQNPLMKASYRIQTGALFSWAFRHDDPDLRAQIERVVECLKLDGTVAKIYRNWFSEDPAPGSPSLTVYAGLGQPGMPGYTLDFGLPNCGRQ